MRIRAVLVDHEKAGHLRLGEAEAPSAQPSEAIINVAAISLNSGELLGAAGRGQGSPIGWDLAGTVAQQAADGSGRAAGKRVVGLVITGGWQGVAPYRGAWAEQVAVPTTQLAELPDTVSFAQAAALPIAGLTALRALEQGGALWKRRVLITAATGAVGDFAVQLAHEAGAYVVATMRRAQGEAAARANGANEVCIGEKTAQAQRFGPYQLIIDSVGGETLGEALSLLAPDGVCVNFGVAASAEVSFNAVDLLRVGGARFSSLDLFHELRRRPAAPDLACLAQAVAEKTLTPHLAATRSWEDVEAIAQQVLNHAFAGKVVLTVD